MVTSRETAAFRDLVLFGAGYQLPALSVQLGEAACDALHVSVEQAILVVLGIEVIFVTLPLVHGHQRYVLPVYTQTQAGAPLSLKVTDAV